MEKESEIDKTTWNKVEKTAVNAGYRDGIADGREQNFQSGFDKGYKLGFETGFTLGLYKGSLKFQEHNDDANLKTILAKTMTGDCQLCSIKNIENEEMSTLENIQTENFRKISIQLKEKFPGIE